MSLEFPNIPDVRGAPVIARSLLFAASAVPALGFEGANLLGNSAQNGPVWGIFDSSNDLVVSPDSIIDFDYRVEYRIGNFPVQQNSFAAYNKVALPFNTAVRMTKGGSQDDRNQFLQDIDTLVASLLLYSIVTPEKTYLNCNAERAELSRRSVKGAYFLEVDLFFMQILQTTAQYSTTSGATQNAKVPAAIPAVNQGTIQGQAPSAAAVVGGTSAIAQSPQ